MVVKLQKSFQQQVNESFGESLHASLLKHSSSNDPETETEREQHRNTLKRMREFFMANSGTASKKSCTDEWNEGDGCGNNTAAEHWSASVISCFWNPQKYLWKGGQITLYLL